MHFVPVHQGEREWPRRQYPTDSPSYPDQPEFFLWIFYVGESDRVGDRVGRHVEQAVHHHQPEKRPERFRKRQAENGHSANQMTESQKFFRGEMTVRVLVAEEHPYNSCN